MNWKGCGRNRSLRYFNLSGNLPGEAEDNHEKCIRIIGVPVGMRTEHLPTYKLHSFPLAPTYLG
jgi:hypothetical protein